MKIVAYCSTTSNARDSALQLHGRLATEVERQMTNAGGHAT
jgi:hypothetical protein